MANKFGKFLLFSALTGAAAYGVYSYLQKREQPLTSVPLDEADDDFDDFSEDLDEDLNSGKSRSYVSLNLDKAEAFANEAFHKAKEVITDSVQQVRETMKSVADSQVIHPSFTDLTQTAKETASENEPETFDEESSREHTDTLNKEEAGTEETPVAPTFSSDSTSSVDNNDSSEQVEEFFDDDKE